MGRQRADSILPLGQQKGVNQIITLTPSQPIGCLTPITGELLTGEADPQDKLKLKCISFNCKALKQNIDYIANLLTDCDILCLTETWLRPGELSGIKLWLNSHLKLQNIQFHVFAKSAMEEIAENYKGRPYGGVAIMCKKNKMVNFKELDSPGNRTLVVGIFDLHNKPVDVICNVYMPYYSTGNADQMEEFVATVDVLQSVLDRYSSLGPVKFVGDFNTQLPSTTPASKTWYRSKGFTKYSMILDNFMCANGLGAVDLQHKSHISYTYFFL